MLNDTQIRNLKPIHKLYRVADSHGLCLEINPSGSKIWRHRYRWNGKATMMSLGDYPFVSLLSARQARDENKQLLKQGINPKRHKLESHSSSSHVTTFKDMFYSWHNNKKDEWSVGYAEDTIQRADCYLFPLIGNMPIDEVTPPVMRKLLLQIQDKGVLDTLYKVKGIASRVFSYSVGMGVIAVNPVRDLPSDIFKKKPNNNYATITEPKEIGWLLNMLENHKGSYEVKSALAIAPHVFLRPSELTGLLWKEVDFEERLIRIGEERMKMKRMHLVPMSSQVFTTLMNLRQIDRGSNYVFPSPRNTNAPITTNSLLAAIRTLGINTDTFTTHGFRHMASTRLNELGFRGDVIEMQLAHAQSNVRAVYNHAQYLEERRDMMQKWADYLDKLKSK